MYNADTPIMGTGVLTAADIDDACKGFPKPFDGETVVSLGVHSGVNSDIMFAHFLDETGDGSSDYWLQRNNPGGMGAVDSAPDQAVRYDSPYHGLIADYAHMLTYTMGDSNPWAANDPRFSLVPADHRGTIRTVGQLGNGVWASEPEYAAIILRIVNDLLTRYNKDAPDSASTKGTAVIPDVRYSLPVRLDLANNAHSFADRPTNPDGRILAIVKHVTGGEDMQGALDWMRGAGGTGAHFVIDKDGAVVQDVSLYNGAWGNGILDKPSLPPQFSGVVGNPNDFTISIEHVGMPDDADFPTDAQLTADARLTADLCDYFHVPVDTDHIIGHNRFDSVNRPNCPGPHWDFTRDVRAVSDLLNGTSGGTNNGTTPTEQPVTTNPDGVSPTAGTGIGNPRPDGGIEAVAGSVDGSGTQPAATDDTTAARHAFADGIFADSITDSGDGRGFTFHYPGATDAGYRVGHGIFDWYTADGGYDGGYERYGVARCSESAATIPGDNGVSTIQVFDRAIARYRDGVVDTLLVGIMAARYLQSHGVIMPADTAW